MDTNQKNKPPRREKPAASRPPQRKAAPKSRTQSGAARKNADAARAARVKAMRAETEQKERANKEAATRKARVEAMRKAQEKKTVRRKVSKPHIPTQPVVYTEPKVFNRNRLIMQLTVIMAVVMALVLGLSIFFKVEKITVSGCDAYSAWTIREASGIEEGDNLMTFSRAKASARIRAELPYVESVRIGIKLPNTVNIEITEIDVVYAIQCQDNIWWLITSDGQVMEQSDNTAIDNYTRIDGVKLRSPIVGENAHAFENVVADATQPEDATEQTLPGGAPMPESIAVTGQQRLSAALQIMKSLELNDIVGEVSEIRVEELGKIVLWYGTRYEVTLGDTSNLDYKIASMKAAIAELSDYETGYLDVSFTTWPDKVGYTPFE